MEKILDFLANYYIYFLIAAGVLFFALIGFIVDLKKKKDEDPIVEEAITPEEVAPVPQVEVMEEVPAVEPETFEVLEQASEESFNPAPPMPVVEETPVYDVPVQEVPTMPEENVVVNEVSVNDIPMNDVSVQESMSVEAIPLDSEVLEVPNPMPEVQPSNPDELG